MAGRGWDGPPDTYLNSAPARNSGSTGSASTLSMSDEDTAAALAREQHREPFGFQAPPDPEPPTPALRRLLARLRGF